MFTSIVIIVIIVVLIVIVIVSGTIMGLGAVLRTSNTRISWMLFVVHGEPEILLSLTCLYRRRLCFSLFHVFLGRP